MDTPFDTGKAAPAKTLAADLATAPPAYLEGALENPALVPELLLVALKNRAVTAAFIQRIARNPAWLKVYEVKAALTLHARTPRAIATNLVRFLWWRDLARVADHAALPPPLRRMAEMILAIRIQEMALGEKIALARVAPRGVMSVLRRDENAMVIRALLQNPRLTEEDALAIASAPGAPGAVLQAIAEDARFAARPAVQKAIVQNRDTPTSTALRIVQTLSTRALNELTHAPHVPQLVRVAAIRLLEARTGSD